MKYNKHILLRKIHRYLGLFIGFQFILWTLGGLYFSWTDIDEIHGDQFRNNIDDQSYISPDLLSNLPDSGLKIKQLKVQKIGDSLYLLINEEMLFNPSTGEFIEGISKEEALLVAADHVLPEFNVKKIEYLTETGSHHEYREFSLPAWLIHYEGAEKLSAYISAKDGSFQRIRHDSWRIFDFLWMMHTMDYKGRDNFNNWLLRSFSILGLITVFSGFILYVDSSKTIWKLRRTKMASGEYPS